MAHIVLQGIAFDAKSTFQKGPKHAPPLIRRALHSGSMNLTAENGKAIDDKVIFDNEDVEISNYFDIEKLTSKLLKSHKKVLTLGGDHSITYPLVKAHKTKYPVLDILHFDAHSDLYHEYAGDPYSHACPFARIMELGFVNRLVQVGIRTQNEHLDAQANKFDVEILTMKDLNQMDQLTFDNPLYISLDMDVFDPSCAPGVSHHEPGGMSSRQVIDLLHRLDAEVIGADIVEYNPDRDLKGMTAYLAAKMLKEIASKMI